MAQDDDESVPLEQFITFLVKDTLPRTIEIVQGLYGDEMSSLSTGQTITITNVKLHHVIGKLKHSQGGMELTVQIPTDYAGSFYIVPETEGFATAGDLAENLMLGCFPGLQSTFINHKAIVLPGGQTVPKLSQLVPSAVLYQEGEQEMLEILLLQDSLISERILLPFDCCGGFVEVIDKNALPLTDVLDSRLLQKRQRCVCLAPSKDNTSIPGLPQNFNGHLILQAIYTVQGFHTDGKEMLEFLSSTDVEVADVTRVGKTQLSRPVVTLGEIHSRMDIRFPLQVEVCESDHFNLALHGGFVSFENGSHLVLHKRTMVKKFVLTKNHGIDSQPPQHFLIGEQYMGRFFRIARKLSTIHECRAFNVTDFVATKSFDSCDRTTICIDVGDLYQVKTYNITYNNGVEIIKAIRKNDNTSVWLDCNASGDFVEVLMDKEPMSISDLTKTSNFPLEVKCEEWGHTAPLKWMKGTLTIECSIMDRCLVATLPTTIKDRGSFEIPVDRFYLTVRMLETVVCEAPTIIPCSEETIKPLNQESYLRIKAFESTSKQVAPKRPPKGIKPRRDGSLVKQRENPKENKQYACANDVLGKIQQDKESLASPKPFPRGRSLLPPQCTSSQVSRTQPDDEDDYEIVEDFYNSLPRSH